MKPGLYIGLISGTSMDAIDCALTEIKAGQTPELKDFINLSIPATLKSKLLRLCDHEAVPLKMLGEADIELGLLFAQAVHEILQKNHLSPSDITAIGSHGQTVWHQPPLSQGRQQIPFTLQIADPNTIAEQTCITTVADFRRRDMAAGGEGAPLMPALHRIFFQDSVTDRVVLNLGGIANISLLPAKSDNFIGFDVGPGNVLMDIWIRAQQGFEYDENGTWAASGKVNEDLLHMLLEDAYFSMPSPKSTGREYFNTTWLKSRLEKLGKNLPPEDIQASLLELTADAVATSVSSLLARGEMIVCGGGARNAQLLARLRKKLPGFEVITSNSLGLDSDSVEAVGFAWLASQALAGKPMDFTQITGASHPVIMGGIYYA